MQAQCLMVAVLVVIFLLSTAAQFTERTDALALLYGLILTAIGVLVYIAL